MKTYYFNTFVLFVILILLGKALFANTNNISQTDSVYNQTWSTSLGGFGQCLDICSSGDIIVAGEDYQNTGIYLAKVNPLGETQWVIAAGSYAEDTIMDIAVDEFDNIFISGIYFGDSITIESNVLHSDSNYSYNYFLAKFNSEGICVWAQNAGFKAPCGGYYCSNTKSSVALDADGNIYLCGNCIGNQTWLNGDSIRSVGYTDLFIAKYGCYGEPEWVKQIHGSDGEYLTSIEVVGSNIYTAGYSYSDSLECNNVYVTNNETPYYFISNLDTAGVFNSFTTYNNFRASISDLLITEAGDIYITGYGYDTVTYFPNETFHNPTHGFIAKYSSGLSLVDIATIATGNGTIYPTELELSKDGKLHLSGGISHNSSIFFPNDSISVQWGRELFISKVDSSLKNDLIYSILVPNSWYYGWLSYNFLFDTVNNIYQTYNNKVERYSKQPFIITSSTQQPSCYNASDGQIELDIIGGITPYGYFWSNGDTSSIISNLTAGSYSVTVVDSLGDNSSKIVFLSQPSEISISYNITPEIDDFSNGAIHVYCNGGTGLKSYSWNTGETTSIVDSLPSGNYYLTISDSNNCTNTFSLFVQDSSTVFECGTVYTDYRNNFDYGTTLIGNQCWMTRNMNIGIMSSSQSNNGIIEKLCYSDNINNCNIYGGLYNWNEMMQYISVEGIRGICPTGWHIPTLSDWEILINAVGDTSSAGGKLKSNSYWQNPNTGATNETGFTGLPAGESFSNTYWGQGHTGYFWSSTTAQNNGIAHKLFYYTPSIYQGSYSKDTSFFSVRCIRDTSIQLSIISEPQSTEVCYEDSAIIYCLSNQPASTYQWYLNGSQILGADSSIYEIPTATYSDTGYYFCQVSYDTMTVFSQVATVQLYPHVDFSLGNDTTINAGDSICYDLTTVFTNALWSDAIGLEYCITDSGTYWFEAIDPFGCVASDTINVSIANNIGNGQPCPGTPTVTDYDGNVYNTVLIGNQCWMKENLNVGTFINSTQNQTNDSILEKYCYNNSLYYCSTFGGLYQWNEMMEYMNQEGSQGICPNGWHIPTDEEWKILEGNADSYYAVGDNVWNSSSFRGTDAGGKLKDTSSNYWLTPNVGATDISGFNAIPVGSTGSNGMFSNYGQTSSWWSSSVQDIDNGRYRSLINSRQDIFRSIANKVTGMSVRCVKNPIDTLAILTHPQSSTTCIGDTLSLTCLSNQPTSTYQWYLNGSQIIGADSSIYEIPSASYSDTGYYFCQVSYDTLIVLSQVANVSVSPGLNPSTGISFVVHPTCNGVNNGSLGIYTHQNDFGSTFLWSNGSTQGGIGGLSPGTYSVTITHPQGCTKVFEETIIEPPVLGVNSTISDVDCPGDSTGAVDLSVSGGVSPYTYIWPDGQSTQDVTGLSAGFYQVAIHDSFNCYKFENITITEPSAFVLSNSISNVSCFGAADGTIDIAFSGGTSPYSFAWSNGETTEDISSISEGNYGFTITDDNYCVNTYSYNVISPDSIQIESTFYHPACYTCANGAITTTVSGGTSPYSYYWNTGQSGNSISGLLPGIYSLLVTDAHGCTNTRAFLLNPGDSLSASATVFSDYYGQHIKCYGDTNGRARAYPVGGLSPYSYLWNNGQTTKTASGLSSGTYHVTVTDSLYNQATASVTLVDPPQFEATALVVDPISCHNQCDGEISITIDSMHTGTSPYVFLWGDSETTQSRNNLCFGYYSAIVIDANNCMVNPSPSVFLSEPDTISLQLIFESNYNGFNVACHAGNDAWVSVNAMGGTPPYLYSSGMAYQSAGMLQNMDAGVHYVSVMDSHGCVETDTVEITQPSALGFSGLQISDPIAPTYADGSISFVPVGGVYPYSIVWSNGQNTTSANNLTAGTYSITISDLNSCSVDTSIVFEQQYQTNTWSYATTGIEHSILIFYSTYVSINNIGLASGDYIGVFYDSLGIEACGGYLQWNGSTAWLSAWGDDTTTLAKEGFAAGESFNWKIWKATNGQSYDMEANYIQPPLFPNEGAFENNGLSGLESLTADTALSVYPNWSYLNSGNNHSILIPDTVDITFEGNSLEIGDYLGVFYDSLGTMVCGGYQEWNGVMVAVAAWGDDTNSNQKEGFALGEEFNWKVWDASQDTIFDVVASYNTEYFSHQGFYDVNGLSGLMGLHTQDLDSQLISLAQYWNIFSTYIVQDQPLLDSMFQDILSQVLLVKNYNGNVYWPVFELNMIGNYDMSNAYQVNMASAQQLTVRGYSIEPDTFSFIIPAGWSMIGYLRKSAADVVSLMSSIQNDLILMKDELGAVYWVAFGLNMIGDMEPGEGYQMFMANQREYTYPSNNLLVSKSGFANNDPVHFKVVGKTGQNMTLGIPITSWAELPEFGDEIGVYDESGALVGSTVFTGGHVAVCIWGDDEFTADKSGMKEDEQYTIKRWSHSNEIEHELKVGSWVEGDGYYKKDKISIVGKLVSNDAPGIDKAHLYQNTPNPFDGNTEFKFYLPVSESIELSIFTSIGERLATVAQGDYTAGYHTLTFDAKGLSEGAYYYRLSTPSFTQTRKMVVVR